MRLYTAYGGKGQLCTPQIRKTTSEKPYFYKSLYRLVFFSISASNSIELMFAAHTQGVFDPLPITRAQVRAFRVAGRSLQPLICWPRRGPWAGRFQRFIGAWLKAARLVAAEPRSMFHWCLITHGFPLLQPNQHLGTNWLQNDKFKTFLSKAKFGTFDEFVADLNPIHAD